MSYYTIDPVVNGQRKQQVVKVGDTTPIGGIIGYDTTQPIPNGWEYYAENQIKKIAPVTPANGNISNQYGTSQTDTYSQEYQNEHNVIVSADTPTTSERVWFKKTRNVWQLPNTNTANGVTLTNNGDGTITLNGTATANADFYVSVNSSDYQNGTDYYLSSNINSSDITLIIANYNGNTYVNSMVNSNQQMPFTMNITNNQLRFIIRALSGKTFNNTIIKIQLEKGSEATSWSSVYTQPSINVDGEEIYNENIMNYSTTEQIIGKWTDGKTLYRKVITTTMASGHTSDEININVPNFGFVIKADIRFNSIGSADYVYGAYYSSATDYMRFFMRNNILQIRLGSNPNGFNIVAILEYTKTTD